MLLGDAITWDAKFGWGQIVPSLALIVSAIALLVNALNYRHGKATKTLDIQAKFEDRFDSAAMYLARKGVAEWWLAGADAPSLPRDQAMQIANFFEGVGSACSAGAIEQRYLFVSLADAARAYHETLRAVVVAPAQATDSTYFKEWVSFVNAARSYAAGQGSTQTDAQLQQAHLLIDAARVVVTAG
jgi:hypothetical protein